MDKDFTELVFILDRSGSMSGLESDTIGGYNSMLDKQRGAEQAVSVTTVLFDDCYEILHDGMDISRLTPLTQKQYYVRGSTALLDAMGTTINKIVQRHNNMPEQKRPRRVLFVITTDGLENSSREFNKAHIRKMIERQKQLGWEFIFLGANIDAVATAGEFGIDASRAADYHADAVGVRKTYEAIGEAIEAYCLSKPMKTTWKKDLEQDFQARKK